MADAAAGSPPGGRRRWVVVALVAVVAVVGAGVALAATRTTEPGDRPPVSTGTSSTTTTTTTTSDGALLRASHGGTSARLHEGGAPTCVRLEPAAATATAPPEVCLSDAQPRLVAGALTSGTVTFVYGIAEGVRSVVANVEQGRVAVTEQAPLGGRLAFLFAVDGPDADGMVLGQPVADDEPPPGAVFGSGLRGVDPNPQRIEPVDLPPPSPIRFVFEHQRQVWAHLESGADVPLTGEQVGAGGGLVSPDGATVLYGRVAGVFDELVALDVRTGASRTVGTAGASAFSPSGALAVALPFDDSPVDVVLAFFEAGSLDADGQVTLGRSDVVGAVRSLAWRSDRELLVATDGPAPQLFVVDARARSLRPVSGAPSGAVQLGRADAEGRHLTLREDGGALEIGTLSIAGGRATYRRSAEVPRGTPEAALDRPAFVFSPMGKVRAEPQGDAHVRLVPGPVEAALIGDGETLFLVTSTGELTYLSSKVRSAAAR